MKGIIYFALCTLPFQRALALDSLKVSPWFQCIPTQLQHRTTPYQSLNQHNRSINKRHQTRKTTFCAVGLPKKTLFATLFQLNAIFGEIQNRLC